MTTIPELLFARKVKFSALPGVHVVELFNERYMIGRGYSVEIGSFEDALNALRREVRGLKTARVLWVSSEAELREGHPR